MPCRALEAFRPLVKVAEKCAAQKVLMPCRALEAFRLRNGG